MIRTAYFKHELSHQEDVINLVAIFRYICVN
jgi:hypothetical protein